MLTIKDLSFAYHEGKTILEHITLDVAQGEVLGILGPNGTGKTTFIKCVNRILQPRSGQILFDGDDIGRLTQQQIARLMAYVPQYINSFFPMSVVDAVMMGRLPYAGRSYSERDKQIVFDILRRMNLEKFAFRSIKEMSGGERQRVFIARAMAQQPRLIILDEPTSSLDLHNQLFILHTIADLAKQNGIAIIMTIHDLNLAAMFCDKLLLLKDTRIFAYGKAQDVLRTENIDVMYRVHTKITTEDGFKHVRLLKEL